MKLTNKAGDGYYFVYDPTAPFPAVVYEQGPSSAGYRCLNIRDADGSLVRRIKYQTDTILSDQTYHYDGLGSTRALSDANGSVTDTYDYDAWGNASHTSGTTSDNPYQYVGQLGYYTHWQEPSFELLQLGVRYYDPGTGRFTERDQIRDEQRSSYEYAWNDPVRLTDASGLEPVDESVCAERRKKCQDGAFANYTRCINRYVTPGGAYDVAICAIGCLPTLIWGKKAYEICLIACSGVTTCAVRVDSASCARGLQDEKRSCEEAYQRCLRRVRY